MTKQTVFSHTIKYIEKIFNSFNEDIGRLMFLEPSKLILAYNEQKKTDKFVQ